MAAAFLDPNSEMGWCGFELVEKEEKDKIFTAPLKRLMSPVAIATPTPSASHYAAPASIFGFLRPASTTRPSPSSTFLSPNAEFEAYISDFSTPPGMPAGSEWNPLDFWRINAEKYKRLSSLAKEILCAMATTAGVERVFSVAGILLSDRRIRTGDVDFETLLFCNVNKDLLPVVKKRKVPESDWKSSTSK